MKVFGSIALFFAILYNCQIFHGPAARGNSNVNESDLKINLNINVDRLNESTVVAGRQQIESRDSRKAKGQCKDVTFGECPISKDSRVYISYSVEGIRICQKLCEITRGCDFYRFHSQTKECKMMARSYKSKCMIRAAPKEKQALPCLRSTHPCDPSSEEDCEYTGNDVRLYQPDEITDDKECQSKCWHAPTCKYWIYNKIKRTCILKGEGTRICSVYGGRKIPDFLYCSRRSFR